MLRYVWICVVCVLMGWSFGIACRPGPVDEPNAEPTQEKLADKTDAGAVDTGTADKTPDVQTPEPRREPPPPPDKRPVDTGPVVPEKVLIDGINGIIVHVTDGDTVYVVKKPGGWASVVRLKGVAAPECFKSKPQGSSFTSCNKDDEAFGLESYKITKKLALGEYRKIKIRCIMKNDECEKGDFGRYLVYLELPDGKDLGEAIIRAGAAWSFTRYEAKKLPEYCRAEADAIKSKSGMWVKSRNTIKQGMSSTTRSWYYHRTSSKSHDTICSQKMGESFARRAGQ